MLKIRRPLGRLIFNMGIAIPGKTVFLIETAPCSCSPPMELEGDMGMGLSIRPYVRQNFVVSAHFQTNRSWDWSQTWWIHSLCHSGIIPFCSCPHESLLFTDLWFIEQFPRICRETVDQIELKWLLCRTKPFCDKTHPRPKANAGLANLCWHKSHLIYSFIITRSITYRQLVVKTGVWWGRPSIFASSCWYHSAFRIYR